MVELRVAILPSGFSKVIDRVKQDLTYSRWGSHSDGSSDESLDHHQRGGTGDFHGELTKVKQSGWFFNDGAEKIG